MSQVLASDIQAENKIETEVKYTGGVERILFKGSFKLKKKRNRVTRQEPDE